MRQSGPDHIIEVHGEELVERMTHAGERGGSSGDLFAPAAHAAAAVNHQTNSHRSILIREELNRSALAVVEDSEVLLTEAADKTTMRINDRDGKRHQVGFDGENL